MNISFLGLNSSFDSASLVEQLVNIETQSRVTPLQVKKQSLQVKQNFYSGVSSKVKSLRDSIDSEDIQSGDETLFPRTVTSTDTSKEYIEVTADGTATPGTFTVSVTNLATSTTRRSTAAMSTGVTGATVVNNTALKGNATLTAGTVTINGTTLTSALDPTTATINDVLTFLNGFAGVTATLTGANTINLTGVTSLGGAGDTSNMLEALGLRNAPIAGLAVTGLQNLDAPKPSAYLSSVGITATDLTINGEALTFDPTSTTFSEFVTLINNSAGTGVSATYDALNGRMLLTNTDTGAISMTMSSTGDALTDMNLGGASETLGTNAQFSISSINGGATLVSNNNSVEGLLTGITIDLNDATASPVTVTIGLDKDAYKKRIDALFTQVNALIKSLNAQNDGFSRGLVSQIKSRITTVFSSSITNTFKSGMEIGFKSTLDGDGKFSGYSIDTTLFEEALDTAPDDVNKLLYGKTGVDIGVLSDGSSGILVLLQELMEAYEDPDVAAEGVLYQVSDTVSNQIKDINKNIERAQASVESYEARLKKQFAQLDIINAQMQQQQSAITGLNSQLAAKQA